MRAPVDCFRLKPSHISCTMRALFKIGGRQREERGELLKRLAGDCFKHYPVRGCFPEGGVRDRGCFPQPPKRSRLTVPGRLLGR